MAKVIIVLYPDPVDGCPRSYPRDTLPVLDHYPNGQSLPTPVAIDFTLGTLLGSVSGGLGLVGWLESLGHEVIVTDSKDGDDSVLDRELADADIVISQPFYPAYLTLDGLRRDHGWSSRSPRASALITLIFRPRSSADSRWPK